MYNVADDEDVEMDLDDDSPSTQAQPLPSDAPPHHNDSPSVQAQPLQPPGPLQHNTSQTGARYMFEVSSDPRQNQDLSERKTRADPAIFVLINSSVIDTLSLLHDDEAAPINLMLWKRFEITENRYHFKLEEASSVSFQILEDILCSADGDRKMTNVPLEELYYFALFTTKYNIDHHSDRVHKWFKAWYINNITRA